MDEASVEPAFRNAGPGRGVWYAQIFLLLCELEAFTELLKALQAM